MDSEGFSLTKEHVLKMIDDKSCIIVDVLGRASYENAHIRGSICVPFDELEDHGWEILTGKRIITYCHGSTCKASERAAEILREHGIEAYTYRGGLEEWIESNLPLEGRSVSQDDGPRDTF
jgi:rhodanese-related sulfurtransferase